MSLSTSGSNLPDNLQGINNLKVFVVEETTAGIITWPAGTNAIIPTGAPDHNQQPSYSDSKEVADTLSKISRYTDMTPEGKWSLSHMLRIAAAGSLPMGAVLAKAYSGVETVSAGSKVVYTPGKTKISMTILIIEGDQGYVLRGCTADTLSFSLSSKGGLEKKYGGGFMEKLWCGTVPYAAGMTYTAGTKKVVLPTGLSDYKKYSPKTRVRIWDADGGTGTGAYLTDGTNAYFELSSSNSADNSIVLGVAINGGWTPATGDQIEPWYPTPVFGTTYDVECRNCRVMFDGVADGNAVKFISGEMSIANAIKYLSDECSQDKVPSAYVPGQRSINAKLKTYFRRDDQKYFYNGFNDVETSLYFEGLPSGGSRANGWQFKTPQTRCNVPALSGDRPRQLDIDFTGLATVAGEDEFSETFGSLA